MTNKPSDVAQTTSVAPRDAQPHHSKDEARNRLVYWLLLVFDLLLLCFKLYSAFHNSAGVDWAEAATPLVGLLIKHLPDVFSFIRRKLTKL
jgi:hypothetical protein